MPLSEGASRGGKLGAVVNPQNAAEEAARLPPIESIGVYFRADFMQVSILKRSGEQTLGLQYVRLVQSGVSCLGRQKTTL